jgi:hypothetical protein
MQRSTLLKWVCAMVLTALLFAGDSAYMMTAVEDDVKPSLQCIVGNLNDLLDSCGANTTANAGCEAASKIPGDTVDSLDKAVNDVEWFSAVPAAVAFVLLLLVSLMILCGKNKQCCYVSAKWFVGLTNVFLVLCVAYYIIIVMMGLANDIDQIKSEWHNTIDTCTTSAQSLATQLEDAEDAVKLYPTAENNATLAAAKEQSAEFTEMCSCLDNLLPTLSVLKGPGIFGLLISILGLVVLNGACCTMGCFRAFDPEPTSRQEARKSKSGKAENSGEFQYETAMGGQMSSSGA